MPTLAPRLLPRSLVSTLVVAVLLPIGLSGCGKRGDPLPPIRLVAQAASDLTVHQRGEELVLDLAYPTSTVAGTPLPPLASAEVLVVRQPFVLGRPAPDLSPREFQILSVPLRTFRGPELVSATSGDRLVLRVPLEGPLPNAAIAIREAEAVKAWEAAAGQSANTEPSAAAGAAAGTSTGNSPASGAATPNPATQPPVFTQKIEIYTLAVRVTPEGGEPSAFSNLSRFIPRQPPAPPAGLTATALADGVELSWVPTPDVNGFLVYRRLAESRAWGAPLATAAATDSKYRDTSAELGKRYIYAVSAAAELAPRVESTVSSEREIAYEDRFPPPPPSGLVALGESQQVRLRWDASVARDVAGYLVFRRDPGGDWRQIEPAPVSAVEYRDGGLASGLTYEYRLIAVDGVGNQGSPSEPVSVAVR